MRRHSTNFIEYLEARKLLENGLKVSLISALSGMSERTIQKIKQSTDFENYKYITNHHKKNKKKWYDKLLRIFG